MEVNRREFLTVGAGTLALAAAPGSQAGSSDPLGVRRDFPAADAAVYLNSAYIAPSPTPVVEAGHAFLRRKLENPIPLGEMLAKTDEVRGQFARLINAAAADIGILFATSEGENIVARN